MKKLSFLLALLTVSAVVVSCGEAESAAPTETQAVNKPTETEGEVSTEELFNPFENLPEKDYGGYEFKIQVRPNDRWIKDQIIEGETGDIVDDAVFRRNSRVSEQYNIQVVGLLSTDYNSDTSARTAIIAGDDAYDVLFPHGRATFTYANEGLLLDWNTDLPCVNMDNPWWDKDARQSFSINEKLYVMTGDISYCSMSAANVMLFNKNLCSQLDIEYPYQDVLDGKWTFEKFDNLARNAAMDLNGDSTMDKDHDRFGYITQKWVGPVQAFETSGLRVVSKDDKDIPYLSFFNARTVEVFDRYFNLADSENVYVDIGDTSYCQDLNTIFQEGRALFFDMNMHDVVEMRSMDADFGIIPWPKYDEAAEYCTNVDAGTNMCAVPITARDPERTSIILESLCAIGYDKVIPAYYEIALQSKASRDNESAAMLDIIKSARVFDLGYYNSDSSGELANLFAKLAESKKTRDISSWYAKREKTAQKALDKIIGKYED
ncbi:MAG: extracellular solute-binding protein [Clostridia bacterium]|nr:extracellular solute-binding protein [Clostridia bacterium]